MSWGTSSSSRGFGNTDPLDRPLPSPILKSEDDSSRLMNQRSSDRANGISASPFSRAEVDEEYLILFMVNLFFDLTLENHFLSCAQLTPENRKLKPITKPAKSAIHAPKSRRVRDVVRDEPSSSHAGSPHEKCGILLDFSEQVTAEQPCLNLKDASVGDPIAEHGVGHQLVHSALPRLKEMFPA